MQLLFLHVWMVSKQKLNYSPVNHETVLDFWSFICKLRRVNFFLIQILQKMFLYQFQARSRKGNFACNDSHGCARCHESFRSPILCHFEFRWQFQSFSFTLWRWGNCDKSFPFDFQPCDHNYEFTAQAFKQAETIYDLPSILLFHHVCPFIFPMQIFSFD